MIEPEYILVSAPNHTGEGFIRHLIAQGFPVAAIVNNSEEKRRMELLGVKRILMVDTKDINTWTVPDFSVGKVFLFERSFTLCCRYIQLCRKWTSKPIYVITHTNNPRMIYKAVGANYIIYTTSSEVSFLGRMLME